MANRFQPTKQCLIKRRSRFEKIKLEMKILVLNCGSSSIKYKLFEMESKEVVAQGGIEKIGMKGSFLKLTLPDDQQVMLEGEILEHRAGIEYILGVLLSEKYGCIKSLDEIDAVGHRVVHGGERFNSSVLITDEVIDILNASIELAPLHNPPNLKGIYSIQELLPGTPQVGVFDTAFIKLCLSMHICMVYPILFMKNMESGVMDFMVLVTAMFPVAHVSS